MSVISEIAEYLEDQGIGTRGTDLFYSRMPDKSTSPMVCVIDRPGPAPDVDITDIKSPNVQIIVRADDYDTGKAKLDAIRALLHRVVNTYLVSGGIYFRIIRAQSEGGHIGTNEAGKDEFSINFGTSVV